MFLMFNARFRIALIGGNLAALSTGNQRGIGGGIKIPETELEALLPFPVKHSGELARRLRFPNLRVAAPSPPFFLCREEGAATRRPTISFFFFSYTKIQTFTTELQKNSPTFVKLNEIKREQ